MIKVYIELIFYEMLHLFRRKAENWEVTIILIIFISLYLHYRMYYLGGKHRKCLCWKRIYLRNRKYLLCAYYILHNNSTCLIRVILHYNYRQCKNIIVVFIYIHNKNNFLKYILSYYHRVSQIPESSSFARVHEFVHHAIIRTFLGGIFWRHSFNEDIMNALGYVPFFYLNSLRSCKRL